MNTNTTIFNAVSDEGVRIDEVYTGYQLVAGALVLGDVARVLAKHNGGVLQHLPPRLTIQGETYTLSSTSLGESYKLYFRPFTDQDTPASNAFEQESYANQVEPYPLAAVSIVEDDRCSRYPSLDPCVD